jgi:hypothetical protein
MIKIDREEMEREKGKRKEEKDGKMNWRISEKERD